MSQSSLVRQLAHDFKDKELLTRALTHRSYASVNNERLEFLGDGVLNFLVAHQLYQRFPKLPEGDLSRLRAQLVKEQTLSEIAISLSVGDFLKLGEGELKSGGWRRPSVLADALEAIIGAIFLDGGYPAAEAVVIRLFQPLLEKIDPQAIGKDAKSLLQEYLQGRKIDLPEYEVLATEGEAHCQTFRVSCHIPKFQITSEGKGSSRRAAEQLAAQAAYEQLLEKGKK
ncbi:ribonuclease III [Methylobacillus gramineus]|uniref:ribonuclease III n=1 Tax=Methylobacillus gramineus TaxID=755169 RepID=UPI001CFFE275|nr:ribonuclease III [Methylobacillus gramineus]MCB5184795.1 ribonuclease III [Methylobacillus gramineus]